MSTRSNIVVKDSDSEHTIYHHCDGYLDGVGKELKEFIDTQYKPYTRTADEFCKQMEYWDSSYKYDDSGIHGDVEYIYYVDIFTNTVEVSVEGIHYNKTPDGRYDENWEVISSYSDVFDI